MNLLLIGDLHLTDRPRDAYRFAIFDWVAALQSKYKPDATWIMGDLCDQKDRHSATLVNKVVEGLLKLSDVNILMGNHDYIDPSTPYFKFLNKLEGVFFVNKPNHFDRVAAIPHCRSQAEFDAACKSFHGHIDYVLVHNTFTGAISESGKRLTGLSPNQVPHANFGVYAGDIHRPQIVGNITYVGSPYHVRFGDNFEPRVLFVSGDERLWLRFDAPKKWNVTIRDPEELIERFKPGDQVKITFELTREEVPEWPHIRQKVQHFCKEERVELHGLSLKINTTKKRNKDVKLSNTPAEVIVEFCKHEGVDSQKREVGLSILKERRV